MKLRTIYPDSSKKKKRKRKKDSHKQNNKLKSGKNN